ncbi:MAG: nucleotidyl transferase AbiEii/AbiGii toxin family protein [Myxococcaceae bacterium]
MRRASCMSKTSCNLTSRPSCEAPSERRLPVGTRSLAQTLQGELRVWNAPIARPTKDLDLLGRTENTVENLVAIVREVCAQSVEPDGLAFDAETVAGALIREEAEHGGVRIKFEGHLGRARVSMQLDVGFGDAVVPAPQEVAIPTLLDFPAPHLRAYRRETTIAEKLHAMVVLGTANGRMKDFYDIWLLSGSYAFERELLSRAVTATFKARNTLLETMPSAFTNEFAGNTLAQRRWSTFIRKSRLADAPESFIDVVRAVRTFATPVLDSTQAGTAWPAGGPWS